MFKGKVLVIGASGFLGSHLAKPLLKDGVEVVLASRDKNNLKKQFSNLNDIALCELNVEDKSSIVECIEEQNPKVVINCSAYGVDFSEQNPIKAYSVNLNGVVNILEACGENTVERYVHLGSCFEYGEKGHNVAEDEPLEPTSLYAATKSGASFLVPYLAKNFSLESVILRPYGMWGPFEPVHRLVPQIIDAYKTNNPLKLTGCKQLRDYSYVKDMADMISRITLHDDFAKYDCVNLASGESIVLKDFVLSVASQLGCEELMKFGEIQYRENELWTVTADITRQSDLLGVLKRTDMKAGLKETLSEYKD